MAYRARGTVLSHTRRRIPRWLALSSGVLGTVLGIATNLYSNEFRVALESSERDVTSAIVRIVVTAVVASGATALIDRWILKRRQRGEIVRGSIRIKPNVERFKPKEGDLVRGRDLHYLESWRNSKDLVIFLPGLGLDASDFIPYLAASRFHCIALTLYGFNIEEKFNEEYLPISLRSHCALAAYAIRELRTQHAGKRITLVGFSIGADVILLLRRFALPLFNEAAIERTVLLDPNISSQTTTISSRIARVERPNSDELIAVLNGTSTEELSFLCLYLHKIMNKRFAHIKRLAGDIVATYHERSSGHFLDYLSRYATKADGDLLVIFSENSREVYNKLLQDIVGREDRDDFENVFFQCEEKNHFELIAVDTLQYWLEEFTLREYSAISNNEQADPAEPQRSI